MFHIKVGVCGVFDTLGQEGWWKLTSIIISVFILSEGHLANYLPCEVTTD